MTITDTLDPFSIYIVDDAPVVIERLAAMLVEDSRISLAGNAPTMEAALQGIAAARPDAVILDINLKGGEQSANGIDLLQQLRATYPHMLIIMCSNHAHPQYISKCLNLGANYFFDKSNDFDKIPETLSNILKHRYPKQ
jgi:DNA-binding NarL/FixJ family response regulator